LWLHDNINTNTNINNINNINSFFSCFFSRDAMTTFMQILLQSTRIALVVILFAQSATVFLSAQKLLPLLNVNKVMEDIKKQPDALEKLTEKLGIKNWGEVTITPLHQNGYSYSSYAKPYSRTMTEDLSYYRFLITTKKDGSGVVSKCTFVVFWRRSEINNRKTIEYTNTWQYFDSTVDEVMVEGRKEPTADEMRDMLFAYMRAQRTKPQGQGAWFGLDNVIEFISIAKDPNKDAHTEKSATEALWKINIAHRAADFKTERAEGIEKLYNCKSGGVRAQVKFTSGKWVIEYLTENWCNENYEDNTPTFDASEARVEAYKFLYATPLDVDPMELWKKTKVIKEVPEVKY
jgi:hypothetical protein